MAYSISAAVSRNNDELYTPDIIIEPIVKLILHRCNLLNIKKPKDLIILCPFDKQQSGFVRLFSDAGFTVKYGHIDTGQDFFTYDYGHWNICVSNPPFSKKLSVFKRLDSLGKPWAMVMNAMALNYQEIINYFVNNEPEFVFFDKRVSYNGKQSSFGSCYICRNLLIDKKVLCYSLLHNNTGINYEPSRLYNNSQVQTK